MRQASLLHSFPTSTLSDAGVVTHILLYSCFGRYLGRCKMHRGGPAEDIKAIIKTSPTVPGRRFVYGIRYRVKHDSQYQQEELQDWTSYLEHPQSILHGFGR